MLEISKNLEKRKIMWLLPIFLETYFKVDIIKKVAGIAAKQSTGTSYLQLGI